MNELIHIPQTSIKSIHAEFTDKAERYNKIPLKLFKSPKDPYLPCETYDCTDLCVDAILKFNTNTLMSSDSISIRWPYVNNGPPDTISYSKKNRYIERLTIGDNKQNSYFFNKPEPGRSISQVYDTYLFNYPLTSVNYIYNEYLDSWRLGLALSREGDSIKYEYEEFPIGYAIQTKNNLTKMVSGNGAPFIETGISTSANIANISLRVKRINFPQGYVQFVYDSVGRKDLIGDKALHKIIVKNLNEDIVKQFKLDYAYMEGNELIDYDTTTLYSWENNYDSYSVQANNGSLENYCAKRRLVLTKITELDKNGNVFEGVTKFTYKTGLPPRFSSAIDAWGFYNGIENKTWAIENGNLIYTNSCMDPSYIDAPKGSLIRIDYPTGAAKSFSLGLNQGKYVEEHPDENAYDQQIGGVRIESETSYDEAISLGNNTEKRYIYKNGWALAKPLLSYNFDAGFSILGDTTYYNQNNVPITTRITKSAVNQTYGVLSNFSHYPYSYTGSGEIGYGEVSETIWNSPNYYDSVTYHFSNPLMYKDSVYRTDYGNGIPTTNLPDPAIASNEWQRGTMLSTATYKSDTEAKLINTKIFNYSMFPQKLGDALATNLTSIQFDNYKGVTTTQRNYSKIFYPITAGFVLPIEHTDVDSRGVGGIFKGITTLKYDNRILLPWYERKISDPNWKYVFRSFGVDYTSISSPIFTVLQPPDLPIETIVMGVDSYLDPPKILNATFNTYNYKGQLTNIYSFHNDTLITLKPGGSFRFAHKNIQFQEDPLLDIISNFCNYNLSLPPSTPPYWNVTPVTESTPIELVLNPLYKKDVEFIWDSTQNSRDLFEKRASDGVIESYIWGYSSPLGKSSRMLLAKIIGANYSAAATLINQQMLNNARDYTDEQIRTELNKIRVGLPQAFVTTYTYKELIGKTSETDPNGNTIYYEYDSANRLKLIRDRNGKVIKYMDFTPAKILQ